DLGAGPPAEAAERVPARAGEAVGEDLIEVGTIAEVLLKDEDEGGEDEHDHDAVVEAGVAGALFGGLAVDALPRVDEQASIPAEHATLLIMKQLVVAAAICVGLAAHATVLVPLDTRALTQRAERIVLGTVESEVSRWSGDHQAIYTDVTIAVTRAYKGAVKPGERVVVRREGGVVDG